MNHRMRVLSTGRRLTLTTVHRILSTVSDRVHIFGRAVHGVAGRNNKRSAYQTGSNYLLKHDDFLLVRQNVTPSIGNGSIPQPIAPASRRTF